MYGVFTGRVVFAAQTAAKSLIILRAPSTKCIEVLDAHITNKSNETNEQMDCLIARATGGTVGTPTSIPLKKHEEGSGAATATMDHTWTTDPTPDADPYDNQGAASLTGYHFEPMEQKRFYVPPSGIAVLRLNTALAVAADLVAEMTIREIG